MAKPIKKAVSPPPKATDTFEICPTCISGTHPGGLKHLDILKR